VRSRSEKVLKKKGTVDPNLSRGEVPSRDIEESLEEEPAMLRRHLTRTRLGAVLAVAAGVLLGAAFGQPGNGDAATAAKPRNKTLPTIAGTAEVGQTLIATRGTWSGSPTTFHYEWARCDSTGAACLGISGATGKIYTVTTGDVGHTLRVMVTARNADGATSAVSAATTVVPPSGCPPGTGTIQVGTLAPPERLVVTDASISPSVTRSTKTIRLHVQIQACGLRPVQGATVFATAIPYNQFTAVHGTTDANGKVTLTEARRSGFPASRHQRLLAVFVRASRPGESVLAGVSYSRVIAFRVSHHH
jgi:hypothetical protein